jgi:hypothetical protein
VAKKENTWEVNKYKSGLFRSLFLCPFINIG